MRETLCKSATKAMYMLKRYLDLNVINIKTALALFDTLIVPIALYGCEVSNINNIMRGKHGIGFEKVMSWKQERLQLHFIRYLLGVNAKATNAAVLGEVGRYPLYIKALKQILKYHTRIKSYNKNSLLADAYKEMRENKITFSWNKSIKEIGKIAGIQDIQNYSISIAEKMIKAKFRQYWKIKLWDDKRPKSYGNKLRTYREFKSIFELEPYLTNVKSHSLRATLTRFRISNHYLMIEQGRFNNTPINKRICKKCQEIEDEEHFFTRCEINKSLRVSYMEKMTKKFKNWATLSDKLKLCFAMSVTCPTITNLTAVYISKSFTLRNTSIH